MKTFSAKPAEVDKKWVLIDADGLIVGRLATLVAMRLRGKHKPSYTPHVDDGDNVIIINAAKAVLTGRKAEQKRYFRHTGYMGHERFTPLESVLAKHPERVVERAVYGMLPKTALGRQVLRRKLRVFAGSTHPHVAQRPTPLQIAATAGTSRIALKGETGER